MKRPFWIIFEGIDGSGKTTQAKLLSKYLNSIGINTIYKHVFDSVAGAIIRDFYLEKDFLSNTMEALLLCASRQAFLDEMEYECTKYDVIIVDRFYLSILAMQGTNGKDIDLIQYIRSRCGISGNTYCFFMNASPFECQKRMVCDNKKRDRIELMGTEFHAEVFKRYKKFLHTEKNVTLIDGSGSIDEVHERVIEATKQILQHSLSHMDGK